MAENIFKKFQALIPSTPLLVGTIAVVNANGSCRVDTPGGGKMVVIGTGYTAGQQVFIKDRIIQGVAPSLTYHELEV
ncbi:MAG: hypothetical protein COA36_11790 [Desulfotalea sp.]|nr:MAG: hypothetical protein COA36_11790 [Desulfotalea sp.]